LHHIIIDLPRVGRIESGVEDGVAWASHPLACPRILQGFQADLTIADARPGAAAHCRQQYVKVE
jgi:hypothetical protein